MYEKRYYRSQARNRKKDSDIDACAAALTAQIIICIILLIGSGVLKKLDIEKHTQLKHEFAQLVDGDNGAEQLSAYFKELKIISKGLFSSIEELFNGSPSDEIHCKPYDGVMQEQETNQYNDAPAANQDSFDYSYLKPQKVVFKRNTYAEISDISRQLNAPKGNTLAPVYLAGNARPPLTGEITSPFAYRIHPLNNKIDFHNGIDIAAPQGKGILAALPGEVIEIGFSDIYGDYIILQHATNLKTFYAHCSKIIADEGMAVNQGERIALVGQTGAATGPHLHFSVIVEEQFVDPYWILSDYLELVE